MSWESVHAGDGVTVPTVSLARHAQRIAHELRTPLTAQRLQLQILARQPDVTANPRNHQLIEAILRNVERMTRLVEDLCDEAALERNQFRVQMGACDLVALIRACVSDSASRYPERQLACEALPPMLVVTTDAERVTQILTNLVSNGLKFSEATQPVVVRLSQMPAWVRVSVRDEGIGLTEVERDLVFTHPDYLPPEERTGLRVGLLLCASLITTLGGRIGVISQKHRGSTFWFELPAEPTHP